MHNVPTLILLAVLMVACTPIPRVIQLSDNLYQIRRTGGWGYDLNELEQEVREQAKIFSEGSGKTFEIIEEKIIPDTRVDIYPADNDTYVLTFRLAEPSVKDR